MSTTKYFRARLRKKKQTKNQTRENIDENAIEACRNSSFRPWFSRIFFLATHQWRLVKWHASAWPYNAYVPLLFRAGRSSSSRPGCSHTSTWPFRPPFSLILPPLISETRKELERKEGKRDIAEQYRPTDDGVWRDNTDCSHARENYWFFQHSRANTRVEKRRGTKERACVLFLYRSVGDDDDGDDDVEEGNGGRHSRAWHGGKRKRVTIRLSPRVIQNDTDSLKGTGTGRLLASYCDDNDGRRRAIGLVAGRLCQLFRQSERSAVKVTTAGAKFNLHLRISQIMIKIF